MFGKLKKYKHKNVYIPIDEDRFNKMIIDLSGVALFLEKLANNDEARKVVKSILNIKSLDKESLTKRSNLIFDIYYDLSTSDKHSHDFWKDKE